MVNHKLLRLSAMLLFYGEVVLLFVTLVLHGGPTEAATLANFAASSDWAAVHLG